MSLRNISLEDQREDLQRRFSLLQGDLKATMENALMTEKQNSEIIAQLKTENKNLKEQSTSSSHELKGQTTTMLGPKGEKVWVYVKTNMSAIEEMQTKEQEVLDLKRSLNALTAEKERLRGFCEDTEKKLRELTGLLSFEGNAKSFCQPVRRLENKMDKVLIKFNEAQSISKTYAKILVKLRKERIGFESQISNMESTLLQKSKDYEELLLLAHDAFQAKELALSELYKFEKGVLEERNQREKEVNEKKILVQHRLDINNKLLQKEKEDQTKRNISPIPESITSARNFNSTTNSLLNARIESFEISMKKLRRSIGASKPEEIVEKYLGFRANKAALENEIRNYATLLENCKGKREILKREVLSLKLSSKIDFNYQNFENLEENRNSILKRVELSREKFTKTNHLLVELFFGVKHLLDFMRSFKFWTIEIDPKIEISHENVEEILTLLNKKSLELINLLKVETYAFQEQNVSVKNTKELKYSEKLIRKASTNVRFFLNVHSDSENDEETNRNDFYEKAFEEETKENRQMIKNESLKVLHRTKKNEEKKKKIKKN